MKKSSAPALHRAGPLTECQLAAADGAAGTFTPPHPGPPTAISYREGKAFSPSKRKTVNTVDYKESFQPRQPIPADKKDLPGFGLFG